MTVKFIGALLLVLGVIAICLLAGISKRQPHTKGGSSGKKYRLSHEYENKGFSEKGQSEGILDIPNETQCDHKFSSQHDPFFNSPSDTESSTPGDNF